MKERINHARRGEMRLLMSDMIDDAIIDGEEDFDTMGPDIITLTSEDGEEYQFELLDRDELDGTEYCALVPMLDGDEAADIEEEGELVFMKVVEEDDEEFLESLEDDDEYERVSAFFTERLSEYFDIQ